MRCQDSRASLTRALASLFRITPVLMGVFLASPAERQWPIKEFEVVSAEDLLPPAPMFNAFSEQLDKWLQAWGGRDYSKRLPVPFVVSLFPRNWSDERLAAYHTSSFWRYLAEYYASLGAGGGMPGPEPPGKRVDYGYLASIARTSDGALTPKTLGLPQRSHR